MRAVLLALLLLSGTAVADCTAVAIEGLHRIGIKLKTIPSVTVNRAHAFSGWYQSGQVAVWGNRDCVVLTHEFYHHYQAQRYAMPVWGSLRWIQFETDAKVATERVFEENPDLPRRVDE